MVQQLKPNRSFFDQNFNMCKLARTRSQNIFVREIFKTMLTNIEFELKCPLKKGVYQRGQQQMFNYTSTFTSDKRLIIPSFLNYDMEFMIKTTFSTISDGNSETIADFEEIYKFVDVA